MQLLLTFICSRTTSKWTENNILCPVVTKDEDCLLFERFCKYMNDKQFVNAYFNSYNDCSIDYKLLVVCLCCCVSWSVSLVTFQPIVWIINKTT